MSPTVFREKGYRFFFFSREEPRVHVHVICADGEAKFEVLSNVVDGKRAHPAISGCLFHFTVDEWHPLDDLGDELVAPESVPVFLRIGGQFEYHGESGYT